jgi:hypothetical protein
LAWECGIDDLTNGLKMGSNVEMHEGEVSCKIEMHSNLNFLIMLGA